MTNLTAHGAPHNLFYEPRKFFGRNHWVLVSGKDQILSLQFCAVFSRLSAKSAIQVLEASKGCAEPGQISPNWTTKQKDGRLFPSSAGTLSRSSPVESRSFRLLWTTIRLLLLLAQHLPQPLVRAAFRPQIAPHDQNDKGEGER